VIFFTSLRSRAAILCFASALLASAQVGARQQQPQQQTLAPGTISGHVFSSDTGAPLAKATVTLTPVQQSANTNPLGGLNILAQVARTDSGGGFQFQQVSPGKYNARAEHIGFVGANYGEDQKKQSPTTPFTVGPGQSLTKIDITLGAAGVISGSISDEDNDPVENVQVAAIRLRYARGGVHQEVQSRNVSTDDQGNYRLFGLVPGFYLVRVLGTSGSGVIQTTGSPNNTSYRPTYYPGTNSIDTAQKIQVAPGTETSGIRFSIGTQVTHRITGIVTGSTTPSESNRFIVQLSRGTPEGPGPGLAGNSVSVTNPDGTFSLNGVPSGDYIVSARGISVGPQNSSMSTPADPVTGFTRVHVVDADTQVTIATSSSSEIKGRIVVSGTSGPPPQGVRVSLQPASGAAAFGSFGQNSVPDASGNFDIRGVSQGEYGFNVAVGQNALYLKQASCSGKDYTTQPLAIESAGTISDCVVTLGADAGSVTGQVMDSGNPVQGLVVVAIPESKALRTVARYTYTARTDANGQFQLTAVIPGDYFLFALKYNDEQSYFAADFADDNMRDAESITVHPNETKTINPKPSGAQ
jgi:hypothetical protein